jgi:hypothetical protein
MRVSPAIALLAALGGSVLAAAARAGAAATLGQPATVGPLPQYEESLPLDHPAVRDDPAAGDDPLARLAARVAAGTLRFDLDARLGVLPSLLRALDVPVESQTLVFSKTSFQFPRISPQLPRAIYFNDDVAVGVVPGSSVIELATMHPRAGARFYVVDGPTRTDALIVRRDVCLRCHHGVATAGVPGLFVSSVFPSGSGTPETDGAIVTDHRTLFADRWGGWFVSGVPASLAHRGNAIATNPARPTALTPFAPGRGLGGVSRTRYLATTSDPVALMVLEHQTQGLDLLLRLGWEARIAAHDHDGRPATAMALTRRIDDAVRYLLFLDEAPWPAPLTTASRFAAMFSARPPADARGRSLRAFDLRSRLLRYRLSPLVYSATFEALPSEVRTRLLARLFDALTGRVPIDDRVRLDGDERTAILEIVRDTLSDLPEAWRAYRSRTAAVP